MGSLERLLEYMVGGALVISIGSLAIVIFAPYVIGYGIVLLLCRAYDKFFPPEEEPHILTDLEWQEMNEKFEKERKREKAKEELEKLIQQNKAAALIQKAEEETEEVEEPEKEFTFSKNFYLERKLNHKEKEALFAQEYKRLKISPYGDSGASYYWVKTRYNESKEHAFFCYLIEKELRKYTKRIELFVNSGPDVIARHTGKVYAFDVETGKNLIRKPEATKDKFERYAEEYYHSYIFVTNKSLKHKYRKMGTVITRSTFRKIISEIFF